MAAAVAGSSDEPMMDINTTPLIDVMLVLLIMFIITIPIQTHAVKLDLPQNHNATPSEPTHNNLTITPDRRVLWNGQEIEDGSEHPLLRLRQTLRATKGQNPVPELHLQPDSEAPYDRVDEVMEAIKRENIDAVGFVGNERYTNY